MGAKMNNRIFLGFDTRQAAAYTALNTSIVTRASSPTSVMPLLQHQLPVKRKGLTGFTWTRFLVPYLCHYNGWGLFMDADMLVLDDIDKLFALRDETKAVMVVKNSLSFEWASLMLFNCGHPDNRMLTPEYIEEAKGLHACQWTENVGELPSEWNHLVGYDKPRSDAKCVHFTQGIPYFPETAESEYAAQWTKELQVASSSRPWAEVMGPSVHAKPVYERLAGAPVLCPKCNSNIEKIEMDSGVKAAHYQCGRVTFNGLFIEGPCK